jgi:hypothetical protein
MCLQEGLNQKCTAYEGLLFLGIVTSARGPPLVLFVCKTSSCDNSLMSIIGSSCLDVSHLTQGPALSV